MNSHKYSLERWHVWSDAPLCYGLSSRGWPQVGPRYRARQTKWRVGSKMSTSEIICHFKSIRGELYGVIGQTSFLASRGDQPLHLDVFLEPEVCPTRSCFASLYGFLENKIQCISPPHFTSLASEYTTRSFYIFTWMFVSFQRGVSFLSKPLIHALLGDTVVYVVLYRKYLHKVPQMLLALICSTNDFTKETHVPGRTVVWDCCRNSSSCP